MATGDLVTRLLLNSSQFDNNLSKSTKQVQQFQRLGNQVGRGVTSSFNSIISVAGKIAPQIGLAVGAFETFNKTISSSETLTDEWGRTLSSAEGVVNSFFSAIARGDFSSFIDGLQDVIRNAREAYDAIDDLGTFMTFKTPEEAEIRSRIEKYKYNIKAGIDVEVNQKKLKQAEDKLGKLTTGESNRSKKSYYASLRASVSASGGGTLTDKEIDKYFKSYGNFQDAHTKAEKVTKQIHALNEEIRKGSTYTYDEWGNIVSKTMTKRAQEATNAVKKLKDENKALLAIDKMSEEEIEKGFKYRTQSANAESSFWSQKSANLRVLNKGNSTHKTSTPKVTGGGGSSYSPIPMYDMAGIDPNSLDTTRLEYYTSAVERLKEQLNDPTLTSDKYVEIKLKLDKAEEDLEKFKNGTLGKVVFDIPDLSKSMPEFKTQVDEAKELYHSWQGVAQVIQSASSAMGGFENESINVAAVIAQTIATIALAYGETLAKDQSSKSNIWMFIAAAAAASISLATTIASIHKATGYANGGIIGGGSLHGDMNIARVNSGEMILNGTQQKNLFNLLNSGNPSLEQGGGNVHFKISGKDLVGVLNNYNKKTSKVI